MVGSGRQWWAVVGSGRHDTEHDTATDHRPRHRPRHCAKDHQVTHLRLLELAQQGDNLRTVKLSVGVRIELAEDHDACRTDARLQWGGVG